MQERERDLIIANKVLVFLAIIIFLFIWTFTPVFKIIAAFIGIACLMLLLYVQHKEKIKKQDMRHSIKVLKNAYNELDEQAKLMAQTDLELNKIQQELDKKITGLYTLHEWGNKVSQTFSINELLDSMTEDFVSKLGFKKAIVVMVNEQIKQLQLQKVINYSSKQTSKIEVELESGDLFTKFLSKPEPLLVNRINEKDPFQNKISQLLDCNSFVIAPILKQKTPIGIVIMGNKSPYIRVTEGDLELVSILASQVGITIQNSMLYEQLWQSHQVLENRVKDRTKELAQANEELKQLNKVKSDFVSSVTHELRTPLTSIVGFTSILIEGKLGKVPAKQLERLGKIKKHSLNLAKLINDLLDISRIESGRVEMQLEEIAIKDVYKNVMEIIQSQAESKNIKLIYNFEPEDIKVWADFGYMEHVFTNILGNAVKFTPKDGTIDVRANQKNESIKISFSDTGPGIPQKDINRIFEEFYRADNETNRKEKGSGLGLSLVKRIIQAHKGEIWAESKPGKGTTFHFTIPLKG